MERRSFLKLVALATVAATLPAVCVATGPASVPVASFRGLMYRGDGSDVSVSRDGGRTWRHHTGLNPDLRIASLDVVGDRLRMSVALGARAFPLTLAHDGVHWRTA